MTENVDKLVEVLVKSLESIKDLNVIIRKLTAKMRNATASTIL